MTLLKDYSELISATELCKDYGRRVGQFLRLKNVQESLQIIEGVYRHLGYDTQIVTVVKGSGKRSGTWVVKPVADLLLAWLERVGVSKQLKKVLEEAYNLEEALPKEEVEMTLTDTSKVQELEERVIEVNGNEDEESLIEVLQVADSIKEEPKPVRLPHEALLKDALERRFLLKNSQRQTPTEDDIKRTISTMYVEYLMVDQGIPTRQECLKFLGNSGLRNQTDLLLYGHTLVSDLGKKFLTKYFESYKRIYDQVVTGEELAGYCLEEVRLDFKYGRNPIKFTISEAERQQAADDWAQMKREKAEEEEAEREREMV